MRRSTMIQLPAMDAHDLVVRMDVLAHPASFFTCPIAVVDEGLILRVILDGEDSELSYDESRAFFGTQLLWKPTSGKCAIVDIDVGGIDKYDGKPLREIFPTFDKGWAPDAQVGLVEFGTPEAYDQMSLWAEILLQSLAESSEGWAKAQETISGVIKAEARVGSNKIRFFLKEWRHNHWRSVSVGEFFYHALETGINGYSADIFDM